MPANDEEETGGVTTDGATPDDDGSFFLGFVLGLLGGVVVSVFALRWVRKRSTRAGFWCGLTVQALVLIFAVAHRGKGVPGGACAKDARFEQLQLRRLPNSQATRSEPSRSTNP